MKEFEEMYGDAVPYKPYLQDGKKHEVKDSDLTNSYWQAFYGAYSDRFPDRGYDFGCDDKCDEDVAAKPKAFVVKEEKYDDGEVLEGYVLAQNAHVVSAPVSTPIVECYTEEKPVVVVVPEKSKKVGTIVAAVVASALFLAFVALSLFRGKDSLLGFFKGDNVDGLFNLIFGTGPDEQLFVKLFNFVAPVSILIAIVLAIASLITLLVKISQKKDLNAVKVLNIVAIVLWVFSAVATICLDSLLVDWYANTAKYDTLLSFLNPCVPGGLQFGYYIGLVLLIIEACICRKLRKNK